MYNVTDANGNVALEAIRTVEVVDTTVPVISLIGSSSLTLIKNASYIEFGASCSDNFDTSCNVIIWWDTVDTSVLWNYTVTYNVTDTNGNVATEITRTVNVVAWDIPVITLTGNATETVEVNTNYVDAWATATDKEDGNITSNLVTINPVDITIVWSYDISYNVTDSSDNIAVQVIREVNVVDTTPPIINLAGSSTLSIFKNTTYTEFGAICSDNFDISCNVIIWWDTVDTSILWTYVVTYNVADTNGNVATEVIRTVNVIAWDIPVISLTGSWVINHEVNTPYSDAWATAADTEDGNITSSITTVNGVNITLTWSYVVSYDVDDFSDNSAVQVTRIVNVVDTTAPVITLTGNPIETVNLWDSYTDAWANCNDNYDTSCTVIVTNPVDVNTLGTYTIEYNVTDTTGNIASTVTRTVNVITGNAPAISLVWTNPITVIKNASYIDSGATASDVEDGSLTNSIVTVNPVDTSTIWSYNVTYNVTDSNLNSAIQVSRIVDVVAGNEPVITINGTSPIFIELGDTYIDSGATASDVEDGSLTNSIVTINPVDTNTLGTYTITYDVNDSSDNTAITQSRTVIVIDNDTDTDGDGLSDAIELIIGTDPSLIDTDGNGVNDSNNDLDNISPIIELWALNSGDGNNDGDLDAIQSDVSSIPNTLNTQFNTLESKDSVISSCWQINNFASKRESSFSLQDNDYDYTLWLWEFEITCATPWATADIQIYLDRIYNTDSWIYRKFDTVSEEYTDISSIVTYTVEILGTTPVTVVNYSITDGGVYDEDGIANGIIVDPSGPAVERRGWWWSVEYDRCDGNDTSGSIYDGICWDENSEDIQDDKVIPEEENNNLEEEQVNIDKEQVSDETFIDFTIENSFETCSIIDDIQNPLYDYRWENYSDTALTKFESQIDKFTQIGIVDGYDDGWFKPFREMSRAEFLKVALISHCYTYRELEWFTPYEDVISNTWQARVIQKAESLWMINGDTTDSWVPVFRPDDIISKAEAIKILMRLSFIQAEETSLTNYSDITVEWHKKYIENGEALGLFNAESGEYIFKPDSWVQRQDMVDLISRLIQLY